MTLARALGVAAVALSLVSGGGGRADAVAAFTLTDAQKREALHYGASSTATEAFDAEWRVENAAGESVLVLTPYYRLAVAARHAAFRNDEVRPADVERILRQQRDRLVLWVTLVGRSEEFARRLSPELRVADRTVKPAFVQNERTALKRNTGDFLARCLYAFPIKDVVPASRVSLVVRDADGRPTWTFTVDFTAMR